MSHNLVEANTWTTNVVVPDDGDAAAAMSVETGLQDVTDRTLYLRTRVPGAAASYNMIVSPCHEPIGTSRFTLHACGIYNSDVTSTGPDRIPLNLPATGTITGLRIYATGLWTAGAHAGLVGTAPYVDLCYKDMTTGGLGISIIVEATDPYASTNLALYEAAHVIDSAVIAHVIVPTYSYYLLVFGEAGANALANKFGVFGFRLTLTP